MTNTAATDQRLDWLRDHAAPLVTTPSHDDDFADLAAFDPLLAGVRVVQLGEQCHGDGTAFDLKVRLIKYLHQRHGFDILAWESGIYGCHYADQALRSGPQEVSDAAELGLFAIWTRSRQVRPLFDYVRAQAATTRPLELWGIDSQLSGTASRDRLDEDLRRRVSDRVADAFASLRAGAPPVGSDADAIRRELETASAAETDPFWKRCLLSLAAETRGREAQLTEGVGGHSRNRDLTMGENLLWLADTMFPDRRIVVWIDSGHASHTFDTHSLPGGERPGELGEEQYVTSGRVARQALGRELLTVHFTAAAGRAGHSDGPPQTFGTIPLKTLDPPFDGSLEDLCVRAGLTDCLVDLRPGTGAPWMQNRAVMRSGGYTTIEAHWPEVFDAVVVHPVMEPSTA